MFNRIDRYLGQLALRIAEASRIIPGIVRTYAETWDESINDASFEIRYRMTHGIPVFATRETWTDYCWETEQIIVAYVPGPQLTDTGIRIQATIDVIDSMLWTIGEEFYSMLTGYVPRWRRDEFQAIDEVILAGAY